MNHRTTGLPLIEFEKVSATTPLDFHLVLLDALPEPDEAPFERPRPGLGPPQPGPEDAFIERLHAQLAERDLLGSHITLFNTADCSAPLAFVYFENRRVLAAAVAGPPALEAWMAAYRERFAGNMTLTVRADGSGRQATRMIDDILARPDAALRAHAPSGYFAEEHARERDEYVRSKSHRTTPEEYDAARLDAAMGTSGLLPGAPASPAALDSFEQTLGRPLPASFRHLYSYADGQPDFFNGFDLMPLTDCRAQQQNLALTYAQLTLEDLRANTRGGGGVLDLAASPGWLPLVDLLGGNYVVMDLTPVHRGAYGQIAVIGHDMPLHYVIGHNLAQFFEHVARFKRGDRHHLGPALTTPWR